MKYISFLFPIGQTKCEHKTKILIYLKINWSFKNYYNQIYIPTVTGSDTHIIQSGQSAIKSHSSM